MERLQTVHEEAEAAGMRRAAETGQRAAEWVEAALEEAPAVANTALRVAADEVVAREASHARTEMPAGAMEDAWQEQQTREAELLRQQREIIT